jgi:hypothetical protein
MSRCAEIRCAVTSFFPTPEDSARPLSLVRTRTAVPKRIPARTSGNSGVSSARFHKVTTVADMLRRMRSTVRFRVLASSPIEENEVESRDSCLNVTRGDTPPLLSRDYEGTIII